MPPAPLNSNCRRIITHCYLLFSGRVQKHICCRKKVPNECQLRKKWRRNVLSRSFHSGVSQFTVHRQIRRCLSWRSQCKLWQYFYLESSYHSGTKQFSSVLSEKRSGVENHGRVVLFMLNIALHRPFSKQQRPSYDIANVHKFNFVETIFK